MAWWRTAPCQAARKAPPLALDVTFRGVRARGKLAKLDANLFEQRLGVALDRLQPSSLTISVSGILRVM
jgi:hypothetical protein